MESLEKNYGFLSSIGIKLLVPKEKNKIEGFIKAPENSPYKNGIFNFELIYSNDYPKKGPELRFKTRIFHNECNWNNGHICIRMLNEWDSRYLLSQILSTLYEFLAVGYYSKMAIIMKQIIGWNLIRCIFQKCQEWVDQFAYKRFNDEYDYLFEEYRGLKRDLDFSSTDYTFVPIDGMNHAFHFHLGKYERDRQVREILFRSNLNPSNISLIAGNRFFCKNGGIE